MEKESYVMLSLGPFCSLHLVSRVFFCSAEAKGSARRAVTSSALPDHSSKPYTAQRHKWSTHKICSRDEPTILADLSLAVDKSSCASDSIDSQVLLVSPIRRDPGESLAASRTRGTTKAALCSKVRASGFGRPLLSHSVLPFATVVAYPSAGREQGLMLWPRKVSARTRRWEVLRAENCVFMTGGHDNIGQNPSGLAGRVKTEFGRQF